jgi:hypothetical protein
MFGATLRQAYDRILTIARASPHLILCQVNEAFPESFYPIFRRMAHALL